MPTFVVTYRTGATEVVEADTYRESGAWLVFSAGGRAQVVLSAEPVRRIDRTDPQPPDNQPGLVFRWAHGTWLTAAGLGSAILGLIDGVTAETASGRVIGALLTAAGVGCAAGVRGTLADSEPGRRRAVLGAMAATAVPVALLAAHVAGGGTETSLRVALALLAVVSAVFVGRLWVAGARPQLPSVLRGFVAAGVVVGLFQFWYEKEYEPASRDAGLTALVGLSRTEVPAGRTLPEFVTATIALKNVTGTKVRVMGSHFNLWTYDPGRGGDALVANGRLNVGNGNWLGPDQEYTERRVFRLPDGARPVMRFVLEVHVVKGNRVTHGRLLRCKNCPVAWEIGETSLVNRLTREARYLVQIPTDEVPVLGSTDPQARFTELDTCVSRLSDWCPSAPDKKLDGVYGRVVIGASTELALETREAAPPSTTPPSPDGPR
ncbi:MAG: hypothetical protein ACR2MO_10870 [Acidimicrobiales bacterium]